MPAARAAQATACPWLPALAATTPAARSCGVSAEIRLKAPRTLNPPRRCGFPPLSEASRAVMRGRRSEPYTGVSRATPVSRSRASRMSARLGAVCVAIFKFSGARLKSGTGIDSENPLKYLSHSRQRIELAALHLIQQAPKLGVVRHCLFQMCLCPRRRDREHLA